MPRNMSFALTTEQVRRREKTVTRRLGWWFLKPGDIVTAVKKARGLRKGEKIQPICQIRIVSTRKEPLSAITDDDLAREGFAAAPRQWFIEMFCQTHRCLSHDEVNRIEFEYL
jgi:hypothetical protein